MGDMKKRRFPSRARSLLSASKLPTLAVAIVAAFGAGALAGHGNAAATTGRENPYAVLLQLGRVLVHVENGYVDPVDRARLVDGAIKGMVDELDPHSAYLRPDEWRQLQSETEGKFGGVGLEVDGREGELVVIAPIDGGPAERAGVKSGDRIVAVDGADARGQSLDRIVKKMRGAPGTRVKLTVRRGGKETLSFELVREIIRLSSVASKLLDGDVAYIRVKLFQEGTHDELVRAAAKLRAEAAGRAITGVLLDMRTNPGGLVDEASEVADEFLSVGGIYSMRRRGQVVEDARARPGGAFATVPVVALVNEWSASAAELVVGALQDNKRATVVGAGTFGKGSVQTIIDLPGGGGLKLTTARYFTPAGHAIQGDGIHPDVLMVSGNHVDRERDLPNHLPPEGPRGGAPPPAPADAGAAIVVADGGAPDMIDARTIPADPSGSSDRVLKAGYELLRGKR